MGCSEGCLDFFDPKNIKNSSRLAGVCYGLLWPGKSQRQRLSMLGSLQLGLLQLCGLKRARNGRQCCRSDDPCRGG